MALVAGVPAFAQSATATIASTNPATLDYGNLRTAWIAVNLAGATYENAADTSHFALTTTIPGLTLNSLWFNGGRTGAILYLRWDGSDFNSAATIGVTVAAAATTHSAELTTTNTAAVSPVRWVNVSAKTVALAEGGSAASYTVALRSPPTATTTVTVASDNAAVTVGGAASTTLTFTATNWATAQSVSVAPVDDDSDAHDELALVTNVATGGGYADSTVASRTVRVTVADDEQTGTDYDADDDRLIEIGSLAQLNAVRWDLDGNGTPVGSATTSYAAAFPSAAAGMGCPDGGDTNQTPDGCRGYELTADLDFDTNGNRRTHTNGSGDSGDAYYNGGAGWDPIGGYTASTRYAAVFRGNGHVIRNLFAKRDDAPISDYAGLFTLLHSSARIESLGLPDAYVQAVDGSAGVVAGWSIGHVVGCYTTGAVVVSGFNNKYAGGLIGDMNGGSMAASYSTASAMTSTGGLRGHAGGLIGKFDLATSPIDNSWAAGPVSAHHSGGLVGRVGSGNPTATASYYDTEATGQTTSPRGTGLGTADLQRPTAATGIYAYWDDYDLDGDGRVDADDDAWDFGQANQYPVLKWGGHSTAAQFALQPDTAPAFATSTPLAAMTFPAGVAIRPFQLPEVTAGNGAYVYTPSGLPAGLSLGAPNCASERTVCGTPSAATSATVTVTVADSDSNEEAGDRDTVTFTITITVRADEPDSEEPANRAPEAASALSAATLAVGERRRVNLAGAFRDPDGDALAYSAVSSNPAVASASVADAALVLEGVADGVATVTVTATDPGNLSVSQTLTATVGTVLTVVGEGAPATGAPSVPEGGTLRLDVRLSMPRREPTAFTWRVLADADPATADADAGEHGDASGTATIAAGATSTEIAIAIADDADVEPAREWFVVEIASDAVALARSRLSAAVLEGVCDRSAATAAALAGGRGCEAPTPAELAGVRVLEMDRRGIEALDPDDLAGLEGLHALLLRGNDLTALPAGLLRSAPTLRWLLLGGNRLAALDEDAFAGLAELRELDLSDNALEELPGGVFAGLSELRRLRLDGNALETLPDGLFAGVGSLRSAFLADNPGAPFALSVELRRTDAAAGEAGPATIRAELAAGAPFAVEVGLTANNAELAAADGSAFEEGAASLAAGDTFGSSVLATAAGSGPAQVSATVGRMPETVCDGAPCWTGLELAAGPTLVLFQVPPLAQPAPAPAPLFGGDLRLPLQSLIDAGDSAAPSWRASSSDPSVAAARIRGGELVVEPAPGAEGVVEIEVEAVDEHGQSATLRFMVEVEFHWPPRVGAGWRSVLGASP